MHLGREGDIPPPPPQIAGTYLGGGGGVNLEATARWTPLANQCVFVSLCLFFFFFFHSLLLVFLLIITLGGTPWFVVCVSKQASKGVYPLLYQETCAYIDTDLEEIDRKDEINLDELTRKEVLKVMNMISNDLEFTMELCKDFPDLKLPTLTSAKIFLVC